MRHNTLRRLPARSRAYSGTTLHYVYYNFARYYTRGYYADECNDDRPVVNAHQAPESIAPHSSVPPNCQRTKTGMPANWSVAKPRPVVGVLSPPSRSATEAPLAQHPDQWSGLCPNPLRIEVPPCRRKLLNAFFFATAFRWPPGSDTLVATSWRTVSYFISPRSDWRSRTAGKPILRPLCIAFLGALLRRPIISVRTLDFGVRRLVAALRFGVRRLVAALGFLGQPRWL